jgi:NADPH:quinone reductase-like Zn-dependent oxidoreductase
MKAVVYDRYGPPDVLRIEEVEPPEVGDGQILVRVRATTMTRTDCYARSGEQLLWHLIQGFRRPKRRILGVEFAGVVESVAPGVQTFAVGDEVFGRRFFGSHAELVVVDAAKTVAHKPANVTFEQAAPATDAAISALVCLRHARVRPGMDVLVYGGSGAIGTAAVQLAKYMGAHVIAVTKTANVELVRSLGADEVLDYESGDDFTKNRPAYDVIVDAVGKETFMHSRHALKPGGHYVSTDGFRNFFLPPIARLSGKHVALPIDRARQEDVKFLASLLETGAFQPVIDSTYPLDQVADAARRVETRQKTGNVVITLG